MVVYSPVFGPNMAHTNEDEGLIYSYVYVMPTRGFAWGRTTDGRNYSAVSTRGSHVRIKVLIILPQN